MKGNLTAPFLNYVSQLRFPYLLLLTAALFLVDLLVPDFIPFADEILLGLLTLILVSIKKKATQAGRPDRTLQQ